MHCSTLHQLCIALCARSATHKGSCRRATGVVKLPENSSRGKLPKGTEAVWPGGGKSKRGRCERLWSGRKSPLSLQL